MSSHPEDCPCVNCNPIPCKDCGMASPGGTHLNERRICRHSRACEGRQMLNAGSSVEAAAARAQGRDLDRDAGGVAPEFTADDWPFNDDPPDPL